MCEMVKEHSNMDSAFPAVGHKCSRHCLGPLTFHPQAAGAGIRLSRGGRQAERTGATFRGGLVFSSRPLRIRERIHIRVHQSTARWQGAMRLGFTSHSPSDRPLPLPSMAIPDLTSTAGHWAVPLPEWCCRPGAQLLFWVSAGGNVYLEDSNGEQRRLLAGVDLSQPLWAMMDIYGQTRCISLVGSEIKGLLFTRKSCPVPERRSSITWNQKYNNLNSGLSRGNDSDGLCAPPQELSADESCVVCMVREVKQALPCGHRCLCYRCTSRVLLQFGTCPLCRQDISLLFAEWGAVPA